MRRVTRTYSEPSLSFCPATRSTRTSFTSGHQSGWVVGSVTTSQTDSRGASISA